MKEYHRISFRFLLAAGLLASLHSLSMNGTPPDPNSTGSGTGNTIQTASGPGATLRIAMAQILCIDGDRSGNWVRIENAVKEAVKANAEIVCFPECCLLGWTNVDAHRRAHPIPGDDTDRLSALARRYQVALCVGLAEKTDDGLYDSVVYIDSAGTIILKHRKINVLAELMDPPYTRGGAVATVETEFGRLGLLVCADTFDESTLVQMENAQPDLVLVPYGWANREDAWPEHGNALHRTVARAAIRFGCPVVGTDAVGQISKGPWAGMVYGGQSITVDAAGKAIATGADRDRDVVVVDIEIARAR